VGKLLQHGVEKALMPTVGREHVEKLARQPRDIDLLETGDNGGAEEDSDPLVVEHADCVAQKGGKVRCEAFSNCASLASTCSVLRKFAQMKVARFSPIRFLLLGMIAVCGIGSPSGCRKSATTANQSAIAPTIAASANAAT
jgi:hypothetical protein